MNKETFLELYDRAKATNPRPRRENCTAGHMRKPVVSMPSLYQEKIITDVLIDGEWSVLLMPECIRVTCAYDKTISHVPEKFTKTIERVTIEHDNQTWIMTLEDGKVSA